MTRNELIEALRVKATRLRRHSIVMTSEAGSGHPTTCLSCADIMATLFFHVMRYEVTDVSNPNNDRFVLSKGHAAPILFAAWAEAGAIPVERLMTLRRIDSEIEGHPTPRFPWAEVGTGSLGQGLSIGVGMALAGKLDRRDYNVYVLLGDGETAEGAVWEAAALAAYYKLDNLVGIVDVNRLGQSQATMYQHDVEVYRRRFDAFGWRTISIDGHDFDQILSAFETARQDDGQPTMIVAKTLKGKGVSFLEDKNGWHGKPLKKGEETERALQELPLDDRPQTSDLRLQAPVTTDPPAATRSADGANIGLPEYTSGQQVATREAYGAALAKLGRANPLVVALDGDTKNSTFSEKFLAEYPDRFFEGFIAEQNIVGMAVGLQTRGKIPFASTFACFFARAYDHIRMAGISQANIKLCGSHVGVSIGEDGPSQMGLEDLAMMRAVPGSVVLYPCDGVSAERMVALAAQHRGIVYIRTSRPKTPVIYPNDEEFVVGGCKVLRSSSEDQLTIIAAGVTLHEALKAYEQLKSEGISVRVIDLYSVKPVDRETLLKSASETNNLVLTVEDHYAEGGLGDAVLDALATGGVRVHKLAVRELPRSGKPEELLDAFGISARAIVQAAKSLVRSEAKGIGVDSSIR
jgi:transketolase